MRLSGVMVKSPSITSSDVSTHFRPVLKSRLGGLTFAEAPPNAISRSNWSPESAEVRPLFKAPREEWFPVLRGTGLQLNNPTSTKKENRKYDNSPLKKINQPVACAAGSSFWRARTHPRLLRAPAREPGASAPTATGRGLSRL